MASAKTSVEIPAPLKEAVQGGSVVLFLGAGASMEAKMPDGSKPPSGEQLRDLLADKFFGKAIPGSDLMQVSEMAASKAGSNNVNEFIRNYLRVFKPSPAHKLLPTFRWHTIATTNYDTLVEDAYAASKSSLQDLLPFVKNREPIEMRRSEVEHPLEYLKLHGCIDHAHDSEIPLLLDSSHFARYRDNRDRLFGRLEDRAHELPFVFVGYTISDPHIAEIIHRLDRVGSRPEYYIVTPHVAQEVKDHWATRRVTVIDSKFGPFMKALNTAIPEMWRKLTPGSLKPDLPLRRHFMTTSDPSPLLIKSLEKDLLHVHESMPTEPQKASDFYRGYDKGFSPIKMDFDARRAVSNDLIYEMINDEKVDGPRFYLLRGAGGTGKTIALKRVAWEIAKDFDAPVLWLQDSGRLRADAISELCGMIGKRIYIVIDQAATRLKELNAFMREAKDKALTVSIVSSERNSTWNTSSGDFEDKWRVQPFEIERLLPREAEDLIGRLKRHSALGVLSTLTPDQQIQAFENADRHLLVALHEVTEGKPFEEIVLNECHSLVPAKAQQLYLDVCSLNQFGAPVRAGVIQRVSAIPFGHFKDTFFKPLEGVVIAEQNTYTGDFEYRARHPRVATLVFKQAYAEDAQRVEQLTRVITSLDEGYRADQEAIRQLISAHNLVKLLTDIKWGREIYERILHHLGEKWYVWHQRAVFEIQHDKGSLEDADLYAETALKLEPEKDSVQHTYAEIARRRASSSSAGTRKAIFQRQARERLGAIKKKSSYSEWSRCKLFLDELSDALAICHPEDDASAEAVSDAAKAARTAIDRTIAAYPTSPEIRSVESDFFHLIQDDRKARTALERAWALSPKNAGIALNLVRIFEKDGNLERASALLDQALERHPDDHGVNLAMARFIIANNSEIDRAAYFLGRAYGASDRNYAARFLHAQFQMTVGKGPEAAKLFGEVDAIAPTDYLPSWSHRRTQLAKRLGRIEGRITRKEESFLFIRYPQFPHDIYANVSASDAAIWRALKKDSRVGFGVGFNRKGPVALDVSNT